MLPSWKEGREGRRCDPCRWNGRPPMTSPADAKPWESGKATATAGHCCCCRSSSFLCCCSSLVSAQRHSCPGLRPQSVCAGGAGDPVKGRMSRARKERQREEKQLIREMSEILPDLQQQSSLIAATGDRVCVRFPQSSRAQKTSGNKRETRIP